MSLNGKPVRLSFLPDDGYTEKGFVRAVPGMFGDLRFTYRPVLVETRSKRLAQMEAVRAEQQDLIVAQTLADRITEWDLKDAAGKPVDVSLAVVRRLKPRLFYKLWGIVLGTEPTEIDPDWSEAEQTELAVDLLESDDGPEPIGVVRQERAEKN